MAIEFTDKWTGVKLKLLMRWYGQLIGVIYIEKQTYDLCFLSYHKSKTEIISQKQSYDLYF